MKEKKPNLTESQKRALAIDEFRRKWIPRASNSALRQIQKDRRAWKALLDEERLWECTLGDGLNRR